VALVAGVVVEGYRSTALMPAAPRAVDEAIDDLPPGGVVYLPVNAGDKLDLSLFAQGEYVLRSTAHHRPMVNGKGSFFPPTYLETSERLRSLPGHLARNCLLAAGVRYVVVTPRVRETTWDNLLDPRRAEPLELLGRYRGDLLYRVPGEANFRCRVGEQDR
jgi:hypothetical protein